MTIDRKRFAKLPRRQRNAARSIARDLFFELRSDHHQFDFDAAESLARERMRSVISAILIGIAVRLVIELIKYWLANRVIEPAAIYEIGEPGNYEISEGDEDAT